jgi:uncharacterized protein YdeI (YjbR/CyaY-like superfamily)
VTTNRPAFFATAARFRAWLEAHHADAKELVVGFFKVASEKPSITYAEALDEALCYGWIDGVRKRRDADSYTIRFTPRRPGSIWSAVNLRHVARLKAARRMRPAGLRVFEARDRGKTRRYSFENRPVPLDAARARRFRANRRAWTWFAAQAPGYRRTAQWWVMSARQDATRDRRLAILIDSSARGVKAPPFILDRRER